MPTLTPEAWAQMRHDYEHTDRPVEDICAEHGISSGTLRDRMRRWRWTRRRAPIPPEGPPPLPPPVLPSPTDRVPAPPALPQAVTDASPLPADPPAEAAPASVEAAEPGTIVPRLQNAVGRVLPAIEATVARLAASATHPREMERAARALAALTRTLRELNALLSQYPVPAADDEPQNLDEFRRQLADKIDRIIAARPGHAGDGTRS